MSSGPASAVVPTLSRSTLFTSVVNLCDTSSFWSDCRFYGTCQWRSLVPTAPSLRGHLPEVVRTVWPTDPALAPSNTDEATSTSSL
jgi:hypothetical protein